MFICLTSNENEFQVKDGVLLCFFLVEDLLQLTDCSRIRDIKEEEEQLIILFYINKEKMNKRYKMVRYMKGFNLKTVYMSL